jgi:hypothetical protein
MSGADLRVLRLSDFDVDGALRETFERLPGETRSGFLRKAALAGAAVAGGLALRPALAAASTSSSDITILNFALALE